MCVLFQINETAVHSVRYIVENSGFVCKSSYPCVLAYVECVCVAPAPPLYARVCAAVTSLCFSTSLPLSPPPHFFLSPPDHWQLGSPVREPSVWTGQRVYCTSWPSGAHTNTHKHLNHTAHLTLGSCSLSGIHW